MAQDYRPGEIVPQSGVYTIPPAARSGLLPTCLPDVTAYAYQRSAFVTSAALAAGRFGSPNAGRKHVSEIEHFEDAQAPVSTSLK